MNWFTPRSLAGVVVGLMAAAACRPTQPAGAPSAPMMPTDGNYQIRYTGDFHAAIGLQLYSFREAARTDPIAMLRMVRRMGITDVETAGLYGMPVERLAEAFKSAGLRPTSMHASYEDFKKTPDIVIANAKALGVKYVGIAWYPHTGAFSEADARRAIADFNQFGRVMKNAGLTFFYHNHGYEPAPYGDGTQLDLIIRDTDPALVLKNVTAQTGLTFTTEKRKVRVLFAEKEKK